MSTYTPSLGLELITPGSQAGLWGNTTNNTFNLIDQAITGVTPINFATASGTTYTLTDFNGAADESRAAVLNITGAATGSNTVVIPNKQKTYLVRNSTGQDVVFATASPSATYTVGAGYSILIFCDGNNNVFTGIASPSVGTLSVNAGGTGATTFGAGGFIKSTGGTNALTVASTVNLATETAGTLPVARGGTGVTSFTSGAVLLGNGSGNLSTVTGSSSGQVLTWNGSNWAAATPTSGGITSISGTSPIVVTGTTTPTISLSTVPVSSGGTGQTSWVSGGALYASGPSTLTSGTLPTSAGGTGATSLTGAGIVVTSGSQTIGGAKTFSSGIAVTGYGSTFAGTGSFFAQYITAPQDGQIGLYYTTGNGWKIGEAVGNEFVIFANANGIGGQYMGYTGTSWIARSDARIKKDLNVISNALDKIDQINGYTGKFIKDDTETVKPMLIAQEIQSVLPEAVSISPSKEGDEIKDILGVSYTEVIPLLIQAIKELKAEVAALKANK